jgi:prepilin-type processing-associated H-X9-DG protein
MERLPWRSLYLGGGRPRSRAFTLPEILVFFCIAAVLTMLIGQSAAFARKASLGAKNAGFHRQIAAALIAHAADHSGNLPYALEKPEVSLPPFAGQTISYPRRLVALGYVTDPAIFFGPLAGDWWQKSGNFTNSKTHKNDPWNYPNYGANRYGAMPYSQPEDNPRLSPANLIRIGSEGVLSQMLLLRDVYNAENDRFGGGELRCNPANMPLAEKTYNNRVYASFADGHVESFSREELIALEAFSNSKIKDNGVAPIFYLKYTR